MKPPNRIYIVAAVLLFMGGAGTVLALQPDPQHKEVTIKQVAAVSKPIVQADATTPVDNTITPPAQQTVATTDTTPVPEQPKYGEDPNTPGIFRIFDPQALIAEAGITTDQQAATELINTLSAGWIYRITDDQGDINRKNFNLCRAYPKIKISIIANDYETNPVTQLKWCNQYATARYGSWTAALDYFNQNNSF